MGSSKSLENQVLDRLRNGDITGREPVSRLTDNLKANHTDVKVVIDRLVTDGKVVVDRTATGQIKRIASSVPVRPQRRHIDRTESSPQAKREHTFAKGVPSTLPDHLCGPVIITQRTVVPPDESSPAEPQNTSEGEEMNEHDSDQLHVVPEAPYHETLTVCLRALRAHADSSGYALNTSVRVVLLGIENMTEAQVSRAMEHLRGMELYITQMTGFRKSSYQLLDMSCEVVSAEMVAHYRETVRAKAHTVAAPDSPPHEHPEGEPVREANDASVVDEVLDRLAGIVERQDGELAELRERLRVVTQQNTELIEANRLAGERNDELERKLMSRDQLSSRVADILERHQ